MASGCEGCGCMSAMASCFQWMQGVCGGGNGMSCTLENVANYMTCGNGCNFCSTITAGGDVRAVTIQPPRMPETIKANEVGTGVLQAASDAREAIV